MKFHRKRRVTPEISMTSMVDVVLLLLFFFMVSTTFNKQTQVKVKLPEADGEKTEAELETIRLTIDANGVYYLEDGDGVSHELLNQKVETLVQALRKRHTPGATVPFVINADGKTPHQAVITALEAANAVGFNQISFATEAKPAE
jgi:biopolymer transport protein ExbD